MRSMTDLEKENRELKKKLAFYENKDSRVNYCPECGSGLITLTTMNLRACDCGYRVEHKLKKGQKSLLVKGLIGG